MHIIDIMKLRSTPAAGVYLTVTRRCPLTCAHCSTQSDMHSEQHAAHIFTNFVKTFTADNHPRLVLITGGEPFLRPKLMHKLIDKSHEVGCHVQSITGMFFARAKRFSPAIDNIIKKLDHLTISMDTYHEAQIPRKNIFNIIDILLARNQHICIQLVGDHEQDPYLIELIENIKNRFSEKVPIMVTLLKPLGRAKPWFEMRDFTLDSALHQGLPCQVASWPVVGYSGMVSACANQDTIDNVPPKHLHLGNVLYDNWQCIKEKCMTSPVLRAIRTLGPQNLLSKFSNKEDNSICSACFHLKHDLLLEKHTAELMQTPTMQSMEKIVIEKQQTYLPYVPKQYAYLLKLGYRGNHDDAY